MRPASRKNCEAKRSLRNEAISASEQKPACEAFMVRSTLCDSFRMALTSLSSCTLSCPSLPSADSNTRTLSSTNVMSIPHTAATSVAASVKNTRCIGVRIVPLIGRKHHPEHLGRESPTQRHTPLRCHSSNSALGTEDRNHPANGRNWWPNALRIGESAGASTSFLRRYSSAAFNIAARLRSTSSFVVAQDETLIRIAVCPCHLVDPHQQVPSAWRRSMVRNVRSAEPKETNTWLMTTSFSTS